MAGAVVQRLARLVRGLGLANVVADRAVITTPAVVALALAGAAVAATVSAAPLGTRLGRRRAASAIEHAAVRRGPIGDACESNNVRMWNK